MTGSLILKRAPIGVSEDDYDVLENGKVVCRTFHLDAAAPEGRPWMWASGQSADSVSRAAHGYAETREAAMAAFAKSWRGNKKPRLQERGKVKGVHPMRGTHGATNS